MNPNQIKILQMKITSKAIKLRDLRIKWWPNLQGFSMTNIPSHLFKLISILDLTIPFLLISPHFTVKCDVYDTNRELLLFFMFLCLCFSRLLSLLFHTPV